METQPEIGAEEISGQQQLAATLEKILELQNKNSRQLVQSLRENVNFQNQVRQGMQKELETLKEQQRGEQFTPILKSVAAVCVEYRKILSDDALSKRTRRTLTLMFDELEDILSEYDAEVFSSAIGEQRRPLLTKIVNTVTTDDKNLHNTIARSRRPGVMRNGRPLYREFVDVYVYDANAGGKKSESVRSE
ncbi:MAG: nucleotide exchange factor GrpE [Selenomonadaceae bacterium]|nr:nucleotide exchange factor GrpE [Selenomonadaceae bacterium]